MKNEPVRVSDATDGDGWVYVGGIPIVEGLSKEEAAGVEKFVEALQRDYMIIERAKYHDIEKHFKDED